MANEFDLPEVDMNQEAFGTPQFSTPEGKTLGNLHPMLAYVLQQHTFTGLLAGQEGGKRSRVMGSGKIHNRALSRAMDEKLLGKSAANSGLTEQQMANIKRFRELSKKADKGQGPGFVEGAKSVLKSELGPSHHISPGETKELEGLRKEADSFLANQSKEVRQGVENRARHHQGTWKAGRAVNKALGVSMAIGTGYDLGPGTGGALGAGLIGAGVAHGVGSFFNGYADARGHAGGFLGYQVNKAFGAVEHLSENGGSLIKGAVRDEATSLARETTKRAALVSKAMPSLKHAGFEGVSRGAAARAGLGKALGRNHALGLSPRNLILYGTAVTLGAAWSGLTRAPVGGRMASRFAGSENTMAMMNDPQNVEARMQAMAHLQSDSMSAGQAMGRESRYFLRQWSMPPDPTMYGVR